MGKCIDCQAHYCDCPSDGVCPSCLQIRENKLLNAEIDGSVSGCGYNVAQLKNWKERMECLFSSGLYIEKLGMKTPEMNILMSIIWSAWNFRANPCTMANDLVRIKNFIKVLDLQQLCLTTENS